MRPPGTAHRDRTWLVLLWALAALWAPAAFILPPPVHASSPITADEFLASPAAQAFKQGQYEDALAGFQALLGEHPDDVLVLRYLAITYDRLKRYPEALATYDKALASSPESPALHYFRGVTSFKVREARKAREAFRQTLALAPDTVYGQQAQQYLEVMERQEAQYEPPGAPKAWDLYLQAGVQFDDNVPAAPESFAADRESFRFVQYLSGGYSFLRKGGWKARAELSSFQSQHPEGDLNDFNLSTFESALDLSYATTLGKKPVLPGLRYSYKPVLLHGSLFSRSHVVSPVLHASLTARTTTSLSYRLTFDDFSDDGFDETISSRDALNHAFGITQYLFFARRRAYLWAGYEYRLNDAEGLNFDFRGHRGTAGLSAPLPLGVRMDLGGEVAREDYPNFQGPMDRRTNRWSGSAALSRAFWTRLAVSLSYSLTREESNFEVLEYERQIGTLTVALTY